MSTIINDKAPNRVTVECNASTTILYILGKMPQSSRVRLSADLPIRDLVGTTLPVGSRSIKIVHKSMNGFFSLLHPSPSIIGQSNPLQPSLVAFSCYCTLSNYSATMHCHNVTFLKFRKNRKKRESAVQKKKKRGSDTVTRDGRSILNDLN